MFSLTRKAALPFLAFFLASLTIPVDVAQARGFGGFHGGGFGGFNRGGFGGDFRGQGSIFHSDGDFNRSAFDLNSGQSAFGDRQGGEFQQNRSNFGQNANFDQNRSDYQQSRQSEINSVQQNRTDDLNSFDQNRTNLQQGRTNDLNTYDQNLDNLQQNRINTANNLQQNRSNTVNNLQQNRINAANNLQQNSQNYWKNNDWNGGGYYYPEWGCCDDDGAGWGAAGLVTGLALGASIASLPQGYTSVPVAQNNYYYYNGAFMAPSSSGYTIVAPPIGAVIPSLTDSFISETSNLPSFEQTIQTFETEETRSSIAQKQDRPCSAFTPITNTIKPDISPIKDEDAENLEVPTSSCAADLTGVPSALEFVEKTTEVTSPAPKTFIAQEELPDRPPEPSTPPSDSEETPPADESDEWHIKIQPYVTIPVSTYGTATVRGRSVNYSLSLGEVLDSLRVTASGRLEAWKGRWGFIFDGYYASLRNIANSQQSRTRTPALTDALNFLLSSEANAKAQELAEVLAQDVQDLREIEELRVSQAIQNLDQQVQDFQATVAQDAQDLQTVDQKIEDFRATLTRDAQELQGLELKIEDLQGLDLNTQRLERIISRNVQDLPSIQKLQELGTKIQDLGKLLPDLGQLKQELAQTQELLEQATQEVKTLLAQKESEILQQLDTEIQNTKALVNQKIQRIDTIQEFIENREPQQLDVESTTELEFDQGIYDFAVSFHIGDLPQYELPDKPSNRAFPLVWFEPIVGVRLNDISLEIEETLDVEISSSLVNFQGTFEETFTKERTWFEPMLGGRLGVQVSDPLILWVRGDVSGFGLAGDTDLSWNIYFGADWWVARSISLQLAYRFYSIDYSNGSGEDEFGFEENFNGPVLAATFYF